MSLCNGAPSAFKDQSHDARRLFWDSRRFQLHRERRLRWPQPAAYQQLFQCRFGDHYSLRHLDLRHGPQRWLDQLCKAQADVDHLGRRVVKIGCPPSVTTTCDGTTQMQRRCRWGARRVLLLRIIWASARNWKRPASCSLGTFLFPNAHGTFATSEDRAYLRGMVVPEPQLMDRS